MNSRVIVGCALWVSIFSCASAFAQAPAPASHVVAGTVVDEQTKSPLGGARVRLIAPATKPAGDGMTGGSAPVQEATADAEGRFLFDAVRPGRYRLVVSLDGFQPLSDNRDVLVTPDGDPPRLVIACTLRITAEVSADVQGAGDSSGTPAATVLNVLPGQAIAAAPGALEDVMRAFQSRPGVAASQDDRNDMLVRGGGAIENATRIDGFDIPNPSHFGTPGSSGGALSIIAPWLIDRAVLRTGGFSVEFGERASSVLDLALKPSAGEHLQGQAGASVGGAMGQADGSFAGGRGTWLVSARRSFLELAFSRGNDRAVPHYGDMVGRFDYALSAAHRIEVLGIAGMDDVLVNGDKANAIRDNQGITIVGVSLRSQWSPKTTSGLFASYARTHIDAEVDGATVSDGSDRSTEVELRLRGEVRRRIGRDGEAMAGVSLKHPDVLFGLDAKGFQNPFALPVTPLHAHSRYSFSDEAGYGEARLPSLGRLRLTPGVRIDHSGTADRFYVSPRVNGEYRVNDRVRLTGAYGLYRQSLPYVWIGSDVHNGALDPVRSRQALAGVLLQLPGGTQAAIEGFDKRYSGYPVNAANEWWHVLVDAAADYESPFVGRLAGAGRLFAHGVDATLSRRFVGRFDLNASYSYWRVAQVGESPTPGGLRRSFHLPAQGWLRADYDIRHQARVGLAWNGPAGWRVATELRYASGRPYTPYDVAWSIGTGTGVMLASAFNTARYPAYHRLDVRIDRSFALRGTRLMVYGELDNVYDRDNLYLYQWNRTARQPRPIYQWGRLPVAGLRWVF